jgi:hypothetical protein
LHHSHFQLKCMFRKFVSFILFTSIICPVDT